jgi:hypothetical protein
MNASASFSREGKEDAATKYDDEDGEDAKKMR